MHRRNGIGGRRRLAAVAAVFGATLLACSGAYAQTSGGVDQYVEDVPSAGGTTHPGKGKPKKDTIKPSVETQIEEQGGSDAPVLTEVATSSDYGAGPKLAGRAEARPCATARSRTPIPRPTCRARRDRRLGRERGAGAETARLAGFLIVLFGISVATLTAAVLRQRRAPRSTSDERRRRDSNPRGRSLCPPNALAGRRLQPLGHFSVPGHGTQRFRLLQ